MNLNTRLQEVAAHTTPDGEWHECEIAGKEYSVRVAHDGPTETYEAIRRHDGTRFSAPLRNGAYEYSGGPWKLDQ